MAGAGGWRWRRALCVAAHPDDEILGAGAAMAALADAGCEVHVLVLGEGVGARFGADARPDDEVAELSGELRRAAEIIGAVPHQLDLPDNRFDSLDLLDVVQRVEGAGARGRPGARLHPPRRRPERRPPRDRRRGADRLPAAARRAARATLLGFETLSSTEWNVPSSGAPFTPNWFWDATAGLERKVAAMDAYRHELREWPHPRSLEGIRVAARRWGMTVGLEAAEAFVLLRHVG